VISDDLVAQLGTLSSQGFPSDCTEFLGIQVWYFIVWPMLDLPAVLGTALHICSSLCDSVPAMSILSRKGLRFCCVLVAYSLARKDGF